MNEQEKGTVRRPARIVRYAVVPVAVLALALGALYVRGEAKAARALSGLTMNHKFKTEQVGLSCDTCHEQNGANPRLMSFPAHDNCSACHAEAIDTASEQKNCELCHTRPDYKTLVRKNQVLSPLVKFDHQQHQKAGVECAQCHAVPDKDILTGNEMIPSMDTCVKCHTDRKVKGANDCSSCHVKGWEKLKPQNHTLAWKTAHGAGLTKDQIDTSCKTCHTKELGNSCAKCHHQAPQTIGKSAACARCHGDGFEKARPKDHTPLWVSSHGKGLAQSKIDRTCSICHNPANGNDCQSCHKREAPKNHTTGWSFKLHGSSARSDRQSCATCHDQAECISCHTTNPPFTHTGSWGTPYDRHCISCHAEGGSYVSGGKPGGNCSLCHQSTDVYAKHRSLQYPGHNVASNCLLCHSISGGFGTNIKHPFPPSAPKCASCHQ